MHEASEDGEGEGIVERRKEETLFVRMGKRTPRLLDNCSAEQPKGTKDGCEGSRGH